MKKNVVVILGPTASGKSDLALYLAEQTNGVIINCDSMQVYNGLRAITARPSRDDENRIPHKLYGYLDLSETNDVLAWRKRAYDEIYTAFANNQTPLVVGGTGFYVNALINGLSPIPDVPTAIRTDVRTQAKSLSDKQLRETVAEFDPDLAHKFSDRQRLTRAWEVYSASGKPLTHWQSLPLEGVPDDLHFYVITLTPPRDWLYERCNRRFAHMMDAGALTEVQTLKSRMDGVCGNGGRIDGGHVDGGHVDPNSPITKACGVPELMAYLNGKTDLESAVEKARTATRRYAKRQITWLNNQIVADLNINLKLNYQKYPEIFEKLQKNGLFSHNSY